MDHALHDLEEVFPEMQYWLSKIPESESNYLSVRYINGTDAVVLALFIRCEE